MTKQDDQYIKMNKYANEIVQLLVKDGKAMDEKILAMTLENIARAMVDVTNAQLKNKVTDTPTTQAALSKMKIAHNCLNKIREQKESIKG